MSFKPAVLGLLAAACVTAAAGGAFLAVRQNGSDRSGMALGAPEHAAPIAATPSAPQPVTETEGVVTPPPAAGAAASKPAEAPEVSPAPEKSPRHDSAHTAAARPPAKDQASTARRDTAPATPNRQPESTTAASGPAASVGSGSSSAKDNGARASAPADPPAPEPARLPDVAPVPPAPRFVEVTVPASAVIGLQVDRSLSSETARLEDRVEARVTRDVMAGGYAAIPAGSRMLGSVVLVDRGGKMKDRARLAVRFHTLVLADGTEVPLRTEQIVREGDSPGNESSRKIGGAAAGGAILGAILGGGKGAMIGGATGVAGGTAAVMAGGRNAATLPAGTIVTARVSEPVTVQVGKE
jgi:hypothetical protein